MKNKNQQTSKWLDNYNDSKVTIPEGFVGDGLFSGPKFKNPAWGGQFQTGGSIPGSVGFTYARTADSAPSEGKYAKKTLPSAQNGDVVNNEDIELPEFVVEAPRYTKPKRFNISNQNFSEADETLINQSSDKIDGLELKMTPEYQYRKYLESLPQLRQGLSREEELRRDMLRYADVTTDLMQLGNFIPHPYARLIGQVGNVAGGTIDAWQSVQDVYEGDYLSAGINAASAFIPNYLSSKGKGYLRSIDNIKPNSVSDKVASLTKKGDFYRPLVYAKPSHVNNPAIKRGLNFNRSTLGTNLTEIVYDATDPKFQNGGEMKFYQEGLDWKPRSMQDGGEVDSFLGKTKKFIAKEISDPVTMKALSVLDYLKPLNNKEVYNTVRPTDYPNAVELPMLAYNYLMGNKTEPLKTRDGKPHISEEFWANALNIPGERQYLKESEYKPSKSKNPNAKYYTIRDIIDEDDLLNLTKDLEAGKKMEINGLSSILDTKWYSKNANTENDISFEDLDPLQRFTLEKSDDGSYVSMYDKYDFDNPALNRMLNTFEIYDRFYLPKKRDGGIIKDNRGQWDHPGEVTEIDSNEITMDPDPKTGKKIKNNLIGISDTGDVQYMQPGNDYKFKGSKVTEFPVAKNGGWLDSYQYGGSVGINQLDEQPKKKLNQLTNFTNNPDKTNWLDNLL